MLVIAVDTCLAACSVAVTEGDRVLASRSEPMLRGHQERLASMVSEVVAATIPLNKLDRIGVTVGPGSFTGLRVGLAFAKGLGLALDRPVAGVGALEALAVSAGSAGFVVAAIDARRAQLYLQVFAGGEALMAPDAVTVADATARMAELYRGGPATLLGSGASLLEGVIPEAVVLTRSAPDPAVVARLAQQSTASARPLYLRAPDAKLPA